MRWIFALCLTVLAAASHAASIDASRIAAIDQAASDFLARTAEARKSGMVPRQSDAAIGPLLDAVFDTSDLTHGPVPYADFDKLDHWLSRINEVGKIYLSAAREAHDFGLFGAEIGRYYDAALGVLRAIVDCLMAELDVHSGAVPSSLDQRKLAQLRSSVTGAYSEMIKIFRAPGVSAVWAAARLASLRGVASSMARFLTPAELARLRAIVRQQAAAIHNKTLREMFWNLAEALATPAPPIAAPAQASTGDNEIALENDGQGYSVLVRINGVLTVKFVVDSGASVVALPSDLVERLTKTGAIAPSDLLGRESFIAADGRKHKGMRLVLRQLDVGGHTVTNVRANVGPAHVPPLLGQTFLAKFKSWTLDNRRHALIISE